MRWGLQENDFFDYCTSGAGTDVYVADLCDDVIDVTAFSALDVGEINKRYVAVVVLFIYFNYV